MKTTRFAVQYRRKRENKTDYKKRAKLLISGKPRAVIRTSIRRTIVQIVEYNEKGDKVMVTADSKSLQKMGWKHGANICTSYLTGFMAGAKAKSKLKGEIIADIVNTYKGGNTYAALKGLVDAGLKINHDPAVFPKPERIRGEHINKDIAKEMDAIKVKLNQ